MLTAIESDDSTSSDRSSDHHQNQNGNDDNDGDNACDHCPRMTAAFSALRWKFQSSLMQGCKFESDEDFLMFLTFSSDEILDTLRRDWKAGSAFQHKQLVKLAAYYRKHSNEDGARWIDRLSPLSLYKFNLEEACGCNGGNTEPSVAVATTESPIPMATIVPISENACSQEEIDVAVELLHPGRHFPSLNPTIETDNSTNTSIAFVSDDDAYDHNYDQYQYQYQYQYQPQYQSKPSRAKPSQAKNSPAKMNTAARSTTELKMMTHGQWDRPEPGFRNAQATAATATSSFDLDSTAGDVSPFPPYLVEPTPIGSFDRVTVVDELPLQDSWISYWGGGVAENRQQPQQRHDVPDRALSQAAVCSHGSHDDGSPLLTPSAAFLDGASSVSASASTPAPAPSSSTATLAFKDAPVHAPNAQPFHKQPASACFLSPAQAQGDNAAAMRCNINIQQLVRLQSQQQLQTQQLQLQQLGGLPSFPCFPPFPDVATAAQQPPAQQPHQLQPAPTGGTNWFCPSAAPPTMPATDDLNLNAMLADSVANDGGDCLQDFTAIMPPPPLDYRMLLSTLFENVDQSTGVQPASSSGRQMNAANGNAEHPNIAPTLLTQPSQMGAFGASPCAPGPAATGLFNTPPTASAPADTTKLVASAPASRLEALESPIPDLSPMAAATQTQQQQQQQPKQGDSAGCAVGLKQKVFLKPSHEVKWSRRYNEMKQFVRDNGHPLIPLDYKPNPSLAHWVKRQRCQYKAKRSGRKSVLTDERQRLLEDLGFCWDSHRAVWEQRFQELALFKKVHNHCNVPAKHPQYPALAVWVKCQRRQYALHVNQQPTNMTLERIRRLNEVGFVWKPRSSSSRASSKA